MALTVDGTYAINVTNDGFAPARVSNLALQSGTTANISLELNIASGSTPITVTRGSGEIRTDARNWETASTAGASPG